MCKADSSKTKEELLSIAQEIAFAKALASNDKSLRDRALRKLKRWLSIQSSQDSTGIRFTEEGFMRLWKGLFYCVWMSDKPLVQEECVDNISNLIHCFTEIEDVQKFMRCFFQSISQSWFGLDSHRLDKYLMLVRRFLRQVFECLHKQDWETGKVEAVSKDIYKSLTLAPVGLVLHLTEIYLEEVAKVGKGELTPPIIVLLIKPFADYLQLSNDSRVLKAITNCIFLNLLRQSDEGIKYQAKFEVWRQMGFPEGDIDVIQEASDSEELPAADAEHDLSEDDGLDNHLDPRAGKVDVFLPPIDFSAEDVRQYLLEVIKRKDCTTKARKTINVIAKKYEVFSQGKYPLGLHKMELPEPEDEEEIIEETAENLLAEEKSAYMEGKQPKKKSVFDIGWKVSSLQDVDIRKNKIPACTGNWKIESIPTKRKVVDCDNLVATMKRIKVTIDDTLIAAPCVAEDENMDISNGNTETENIFTSKSQAGKKKRKNQKGNVAISNSNINLNVNILGKNESELNSSIVSNQGSQKQKNNEAANDWGFNNEWDMTTENEVNPALVVPSSPITPKGFVNSSPKKKFTGVKPSPARNVANNTSLNSSKRVSFHLNRNTEQEEKEYKITLKNSPCVPFDADKKPRHSALKSSTISSPINPFIKIGENC